MNIVSPDFRVSTLVAIAGLTLLAAVGVMTLLAVPAPGGSLDDAERWVLIARGMFGAIAAILLGVGVALNLSLAVWVAFAVGVLTLTDLVMREQPALSGYILQIVEGLGAALVLTGLCGRWLHTRMRAPSAVAHRSTWPLAERLVVAILLVEALALVSWLFVHAMLLMLGGLIGFYEYWRIPFGIVVLALVVVAGGSARGDSWWATATRFAAFVGCLAAMALAYRTDASPVHQVATTGAALLAFIGLGLILAQLTAHEASSR